MFGAVLKPAADCLRCVFGAEQLGPSADLTRHPHECVNTIWGVAKEHARGVETVGGRWTTLVAAKAVLA